MGYLRKGASVKTLSPAVSVTEASNRELDDLKRQFSKLSNNVAKKDRKEKFSEVTSSFKKAIPKGIRLPDSMVTNRHLYVGGKGKVNLF